MEAFTRKVLSLVLALLMTLSVIAVTPITTYAATPAISITGTSVSGDTMTVNYQVTKTGSSDTNGWYNVFATYGFSDGYDMTENALVVNRCSVLSKTGSFQLTGKPYGNYYVQIKMVNDWGEGSGYCSPTNFSVAIPTPSIQTSGISETSATISYSVPKDVQNYTVTVNGTSYDMGKTTSKMVTGLTAGQTYTARVHATSHGVVSSTASQSFLTVTAPFIVVLPSTLNFDSAYGQKNISVTSNINWSVSADAPWLSVSPSSNSNNGTICVIATENTNASLRSGTVTITGNDITRTVSVTQAGVAPFIVVSPSTLNFDSAYGQKNISVTSNINWSVSADAPWLSVSPSSSSNNGTICVIATENTNASLRSGTVTITGNDITRTVSVTQAGVAPFIVVSPSTLNFDSAYGQKNISVTSNINWSVSADAPWLSVSPSSSSNNGTICVIATENTNASSRSGTVTITGNDITRTVSVTQAGVAPFIVVSPSTLNFDSAYGQKNISVTSNINWSVSADAPWLSVSPSSSSNNGTICVIATENTNASLRSGTVTITGNDITRTVSVTQAGVAPFIVVSPSTLNFDSAYGQKNISVTSNISWSVSADAPWLSVSPSSNSNNGTICVIATENTNASLRSGTVTITGNDITRTVSVTQAGVAPFIEVSPSTLNFDSAYGKKNISVTSNINWSAFADAPWLSVSPSSSSNNGTIYVTATENTNASSRSGTVTITGNDITRTVSVTQAGADMPSPWAVQGINKAVERGLVPDELNRNFQGDTSRLDFCRAAIKFVGTYYDMPIDEILQSKGLSRATFSDARPDDIGLGASQDVGAAAALQITSGTGNNNFNPNANITREQAATLLKNTLSAIGVSVSGSKIYDDSNLISDWAKDAVHSISAADIMSGVGNNSFDPKGSFTHEQTIITFNRIYDYAKNGQTTTPQPDSPETVDNGIAKLAKPQITSLKSEPYKTNETLVVSGTWSYPTEAVRIMIRKIAPIEKTAQDVNELMTVWNKNEIGYCSYSTPLSWLEPGTYNVCVRVEYSNGQYEDKWNDVVKQIVIEKPEFNPIWPTEGGKITEGDYYGSGKKHSCRYAHGVDINVGVGTDVLATEAGIVTEVKNMGNTSYGKFIVIRHNNGTHSLYAHLSEQLVKVGDTVTQGQLIGKSGNTGGSTGPHLHFELEISKKDKLADFFPGR